MYKIIAFTILGLLLLSLVSACAMKSDATPARSTSLYEKAQTAAEKGDQEAAEVLAGVDALLLSQGKQSPPEETVVESGIETPEGIRIYVEGVTPFYLKIYNSPEFNNLDEMNSYLEKRQAALERLVNQDSAQRIEIAISPTQYLTLTELLEMRDSYHVDIDGVAFEVFQNDQRKAATFVGEPREAGERMLVDFSQPLEDIESGLRQLVPAQPPGGAEAIDATELEFKAAWIRGKLPAGDAAALDDQVSIMLVDPITDLLDMFEGEAADIRVVQMPHLLDKKRLLQGGDYSFSE